MKKLDEDSIKSYLSISYNLSSDISSITSRAYAKAKDETEKNLIMSMYMDAMKEISNLENFYYDMLDEDDE